MRPSCTCTRRFHLLDLSSGYCLHWKNCLVPADMGRNAEVWLDAVVLLARRPSDANPDALHPGKARESSEGESELSPRMFPCFLGPEALKLSVTPARQAELVGLSQLRYFASCGSRVLRTLAQVWGRAAPSVPFCFENHP